MYLLFDFVNERGDNIIKAWGNGLTPREQGKLDSKLDIIQNCNDPNLIPHLIAGTDTRHIYKLQINGRVAPRPMLCRGPEKMGDEFTLLLGAVERDWKLIPHNAPSIAAENREILIKDRLRRVAHEQFD